jgi:perosamine synthetase
MRYLAPVGTPISLNDLKNWLYNIVSSKDIFEVFRKNICEKYNVRHCFFTSSGRTALYLLLQSFNKLAGGDRNEVVVSSYNSFSVPSSIAKAGLKIRVSDIDMRSLDYDYKKLSDIDFTKVLCILSSNLYGIPNDLIKLNQIAKEHGIFLIDDAAQCMGGTIDGTYSGTFGDAGIYSLGKGKNITSVEGGIIVTNSDDIASLIKSKTTYLPDLSMSGKLSYIIQLVLYAAFLHPYLCWVPANINYFSVPRYESDFPVNSYSRLLGAIGLQLFNNINTIENIRVNNAGYLQENLGNLPFIKLIQYNNNVKPVFLRFPVLIDNEAIRNSILKGFKESGIWFVKPYPVSIMDIKEIKDIIVGSNDNAEAGRLVAEQLITLPTHSYVTEKDLDTINKIIRRAIKK